MERLQIPEKEALEKAVECLEEVKKILFAYLHTKNCVAHLVYNEVENCLRELYLD